MFDLVFAEGVEAIFRFALALLKHSEAHILELEFEDLVEYLKNGIFEVYKVRRPFTLVLVSWARDLTAISRARARSLTKLPRTRSQGCTTPPSLCAKP